MAGFVFKLNPGAVPELEKNAQIQAELKSRAEAAARAAATAAGLSDGFVVDVGVGPNRAYARVVTATADAMVAEAKDRVLTRSIDAAR